jgi:hypothetical protein
MNSAQTSLCEWVTNNINSDIHIIMIKKIVKREYFVVYFYRLLSVN